MVGSPPLPGLLPLVEFSEELLDSLQGPAGVSLRPPSGLGLPPCFLLPGPRLPQEVFVDARGGGRRGVF